MRKLVWKVKRMQPPVNLPNRQWRGLQFYEAADQGGGRYQVRAIANPVEYGKPAWGLIHIVNGSKRVVGDEFYDTLREAKEYAQRDHQTK